MREEKHGIARWTQAIPATESWRSLGIFCLQICLFCAATAMVSPAQDERPSNDSVTLTTLFSFDYTDGQYPTGTLVQGLDGNFYGTTQNGGANGDGTVFRITPGGSLTTVHTFDGTDGLYANGLFLATDGNLYSTSNRGGANNEGTVFKITPRGTFSTLHSFDGTDGAFPDDPLIQATDGNFYGTTSFDGGADGRGTVFKITPDGTLTTLYIFCSQANCTDGEFPVGGLVQGTDGNFYGTTSSGGTSTTCGSACGTVFKVSPGGTLTTLHSFDSTDGGYSQAALIQATDGNFYGTTYYGGTGANCPYGFPGLCGTAFKITPDGVLTTLYNFGSQTGGTDGSNPSSALVQAADGSFYGTNPNAGTSGYGTVFRINPKGVLTTLHEFDGTDGFGADGLVQGTDGAFYAPTPAGGPSTACAPYTGCGTVFSVAVGLGPFVETLPTSGKVGAQIKILGSDLTGATSVSFNGTPATFKVASHSLILATVPEGSIGGLVTVTTPTGTLKSNVRFQVRP